MLLKGKTLLESGINENGKRDQLFKILKFVSGCNLIFNVIRETMRKSHKGLIVPTTFCCQSTEFNGVVGNSSCTLFDEHEAFGSRRGASGNIKYPL